MYTISGTNQYTHNLVFTLINKRGILAVYFVHFTYTRQVIFILSKPLHFTSVSLHFYPVAYTMGSLVYEVNSEAWNLQLLSCTFILPSFRPWTVDLSCKYSPLSWTKLKFTCFHILPYSTAFVTKHDGIWVFLKKGWLRIFLSRLIFIKLGDDRFLIVVQNWSKVC